MNTMLINTLTENLVIIVIRPQNDFTVMNPSRIRNTLFFLGQIEEKGKSGAHLIHKTDSSAMCHDMSLNGIHIISSYST